MSKMVLVEEGTTNRHPKPYIEGTLTNVVWGNKGTRVSFGHLGQYSVELTDNTTVRPINNSPSSLGAFVAGDVITFSVWIFAPDGATCGIMVRTPESSSNNSPAWTIPAGVWTRIHHTYTMPAGSTQIRDFWVTCTGHVFVTESQAELKPYPTSICPAFTGLGALEPGNQWNGAPHASTSTRTAGDLTIPCATSPAAFGCKWSEDGITTHTLYSESLGQVIGSYGSITWSGGNLHVTTSRRLWISQVAAFDRALTPTEQTRLDEIIDANLLDWYV